MNITDDGVIVSDCLLGSYAIHPLVQHYSSLILVSISFQFVLFLFCFTVVVVDITICWNFTIQTVLPYH